ncbi:CoA transferase, partial [Streptomyces europaeiscabiei]|uniref:CoA transferase n=1 Tax=Streptomyces europaeiscabiei TaxID=146819 RepID=UPI001F09DB17
AVREAAEELGGLESARRAEQRLAELVAERTELDGEERADEDVLQDAEGWLAEWEATRAELRSRIESAQEDATRAEQLAVQRDPAEKRLGAARQRDQLGRDTEDAQARVLRLAERAVEARAHWLDLKEQRLSGIAAELAAELVDGRPCAVCGGTEHPEPARKVAGHVDRETEERALAAFQRADEERAEAERRLGVLRQAYAAASAEAGDAPTERLAALVEEVEERYAQARAGASGLHPAQEALLHAERERDRRIAAQQEAAVRGGPLVEWRRLDSVGTPRARVLGPLAEAPLSPAAGVRVLDLTRVIAGPVATRTLALLGADVLRVDPPGMPEILDQHADTGFGKRSATLDLTARADRRAFEDLLAQADVVVMGYRPGALGRFALTPDAPALRRPGLVVAQLSAWGGTGPWAERRGFDSLVQVATGIAAAEGSSR